MERTKTEKIKYRKIGGGSLRLGGRIIKSGQTFKAYPSDIPEAFNDTIIPLEKVPEEEKVEVKAVKSEYTAKKRENSNWYDVFDSKGKQINEKALKKTQADDLVKDLEG